ncbi:MAG: hypothetical protein ACR2ID_10095 [Chthoniobacterales bacterium]
MLLRFALLFVGTASTAWALSEQTAHEQYDCAAGGKLVIDVDFGTIDVTTGSDGKVAVEAYRKIDSSDETREKSSLGKIRTEVPMLATKADDDRLAGTLNGGGKSIVLRASVGSITIRPAAETTASR